MHKAREMLAHCGEMATIGEPAVEGARDDLSSHGRADYLDAGAVNVLLHQGRLQWMLIDG